jgi:hypothetical protein
MVFWPLKGTVLGALFQRGISVQVRFRQDEHDATGKPFQFTPRRQCRPIGVGEDV